MPDTALRPPLPDTDYTAAVEAAAEALCDRDWRAAGMWRSLPDDAGARAYWREQAAAAVNAVWPHLHGAAYQQGRDSVLEGDPEVVRYTWRRETE